jgi:adenosylcobyric acid synthase
MTRKVMFQGTSSGVGKTLLTAGVCRYLQRQGLDVAPYKTLNLSLNSFVTEDGGEIGISQAFQAWACGIEPTVDMNPVLLKPKGEGGLQVILKGKPYVDVDHDHTIRREVFLDAIGDCFGRLSRDHSDIVLEGSGSPAEINLRKSEVANMTTAQLTKSPVILIGDIEKGGVFAALYGTYHLLPEEHKCLVKGFVINRFRGDESILGKGIERLEREMGVPCLGVLPYLRMRFPEEDSLSMSTGGSGSGDDIRKVWMSNLDRFVDEALAHMDLATLEDIMRNGVGF